MSCRCMKPYFKSWTSISRSNKKPKDLYMKYRYNKLQVMNVLRASKANLLYNLITTNKPRHTRHTKLLCQNMIIIRGDSSY